MKNKNVMRKVFMKVKIFVSAILMASMFCASGSNTGNVKAATDIQSSVKLADNSDKVTFSDVHSGDWYYNTVTEMAQRRFPQLKIPHPISQTHA